VLVAGRCVQAAGAALVVATVLVLLAAVEGSESRAAQTWASAGVLGAALGPAVGGILTQLAGWESIFFVQAPVALVPVLALWRLGAPTGVSAGRAGRPHVGANLALLLGSAALSAALFLLVILLVNGWSIEPARAGLIVTLMPLAAIAAGRLAAARVSRVVRAVTGFVLMAGGLAALGLLPRTGWAWTIPPELLVGAGLGMTVAALTAQALEGRPHQSAHGGWTIASRHTGIVLGLIVLTPVFAHELARNQDEATRAGAAIVLDSSIEPLHKIRVAQDVLRTIDSANGRLPDVRPAFATDEPSGDSTELRRVGDALQAQLERAVTSAFGPPFLLAALFALAALAVVAVTRDVEP
jgi:MFS family permease